MEQPGTAAYGKISLSKKTYKEVKQINQGTFIVSSILLGFYIS